MQPVLHPVGKGGMQPVLSRGYGRHAARATRGYGRHAARATRGVWEAWWEVYPGIPQGVPRWVYTPPTMLPTMPPWVHPAPSMLIHYEQAGYTLRCGAQ